MSASKPFWSSILGLAIRWLTYIPAGMVLLYTIALVSFVFMKWLFQDLRGFVIIGLMFGGVAFIFMAGYVYCACLKLVELMCPSKRIGMIVFAIVYYAFMITNVGYGVFGTDDPLGQKVSLVLINLVYGVLTLVTLYGMRVEANRTQRSI